MAKRKRRAHFERVCEVCGRTFTAATTAARYCGKAHSQKARDARRTHLPGERCVNCKAVESASFRKMTLYGSEVALILCAGCFERFAAQQRRERHLCHEWERPLNAIADAKPRRSHD